MALHIERRVGAKVVIETREGDVVVIEVVGARRGATRLTFNAAAHVRIHRFEVWVRRRAERRKTA